MRGKLNLSGEIRPSARGCGHYHSSFIIHPSAGIAGLRSGEPEYEMQINRSLQETAPARLLFRPVGLHYGRPPIRTETPLLLQRWQAASRLIRETLAGAECGIRLMGCCCASFSTDHERTYGVLSQWTTRAALPTIVLVSMIGIGGRGIPVSEDPG